LHNKIKEMDFLKVFGINANNQGASTGSIWIRSSGEKIDSFSPVDGKLIGSIIAADKASYEKIIQTA
jgi:aldehyde dehydrogenase (NAD+)